MVVTMCSAVYSFSVTVEWYPPYL